MTPTPRTVLPTTLVGEALAMMNQRQRPVTVLFVVEDEQAGRHRPHARPAQLGVA